MSVELVMSTYHFSAGFFAHPDISVRYVSVVRKERKEEVRKERSVKKNDYLLDRAGI